jgi:quinol-cytochrome oxidoreductase complex cytochrome b subunit
MGWIKKIKESRVWKSYFREEYDDTSRGRTRRILSNVWFHIHPAKISKKAINPSYTLCLGGISFLLFIILTVSGILLMFYYVPDVNRAYDDMLDLETVVPFGIPLRNIHRWAAHGMIIAVVGHMCRVFFTGAYKPPREFNWVVGVSLLLLTLLLSFTGYLLPWDQLAYWAITVGTNIASYAPVVGPKIRFLLLGGNTVGQNALIRFYVLHVILLPTLMMLLMILHFWRVRKDGFSRGL